VNSVPATLRILRCAAMVGRGDRAALFTPRTWTIVWSVRVLAETSFFALVGRLLASPDQVAYLLVGSAVVTAATTSMLTVQSTAWERLAGTLPLLVASPAGPLVPFLGRSVMWLPDALAFSLGSLIVGGLVFGVDLQAGGLLWAVPLLAGCALGTYGLAAFVGALAVRTVNARNLASHLVRTIMLVVTGASVPVSYFPSWVGWISALVPATHALRGLREALAGAAATAALPDLLLTLATGATWLVLAALTIERFADRARADGSIEFGGD